MAEVRRHSRCLTLDISKRDVRGLEVELKTTITRLVLPLEQIRVEAKTLSHEQPSVCVHVSTYICARFLIHSMMGGGSVYSHSHGKPWPRWNVHMSPSGPGRRSTDPRIHCRHRTQRHRQSVTHGVKQGNCSRQTSSLPCLKAGKSLRKSKCKMLGSCSSGSRAEELKREPCWSWLDNC